MTQIEIMQKAIDLQKLTINSLWNDKKQLESTCQQWKSEAERALKLAEEYKGQRDRARELAGELWKLLGGKLSSITKTELEQRLKAEGVIK